MHRARLRERLESVAQDLRFALRQFRKSPGFAFIATLTLALGRRRDDGDLQRREWRGASAASVRAPRADRAALGARREGASALLRRSDLRRRRAGHALFRGSGGVRARAECRSSTTARWSACRRPRCRRDSSTRCRRSRLLGRTFVPEEQQLGAPMAVVISHALWVHRFGSSPRAIGSTLISDRKPITVVGVLREGEDFPAGTDLWYPREIYEKDASYTAHNWRVIGRVKNGDLARAGKSRPVDDAAAPARIARRGHLDLRRNGDRIARADRRQHQAALASSARRIGGAAADRVRERRESADRAHGRARE